MFRQPGMEALRCPVFIFGAWGSSHHHPSDSGVLQDHLASRLIPQINVPLPCIWGVSQVPLERPFVRLNAEARPSTESSRSGSSSDVRAPVATRVRSREDSAAESGHQNMHHAHSV